MKKIDYYFSAGHNQTHLNKLVKEPLFQQIIDYFRLQNGKTVLLRSLKKAIVTEENIEYILEQMITHNLIERSERRYKLLIPIYEAKERVINIADDDLSKLTSFGKTLNQEELAVFLGELLWKECFPDDVNYFFGIEREEGTEGRGFFEKIAVGNQELSFVTIQNDKNFSIDLASYFSNLKTNQISPEFLPLYNLIGDVDLDYYINQVKRLIKNAEKNKKIGNRRNIFLDSLVISNNLSINEAGSLILNTPIIKEKEGANLVLGMKIVISLIDKIDRQSESLSINERILSNQYLYQQIFTQLAKNKKIITYFEL